MKNIKDLMSLGIGIEVTPGEYVTPTLILPIAKDTARYKPEFKKDEFKVASKYHGSTQTDIVTFGGVVNITFSIPLPADYSSIDTLLNILQFSKTLISEEGSEGAEYVYTTASENTASLTIIEPRRTLKAVGVTGTATIKAAVGSAVLLEIALTGRYIDPEELLVADVVSVFHSIKSI